MRLSQQTAICQLNPLRYRGYVYDTETELYYLQSRYYNPEMGRFINADGFVATGQGFLGNNMFAYCGNNPICRNDPTGHWWQIIVPMIIVGAMLHKCSSNTNDVLVVSNNDDAWMESSTTMGNDMANAIGSSTSHVEAVTDENFDSVWNNTTSNHVIIHTHGSPNSLQGNGFHFTTSDSALLQQNMNIEFVLITSCSVGGNNGTNANIGQLISQKIAPDGLVVCSTTTVSGGATTFTAMDGGSWIVYQNGVQIAASFPTTITMEDIARYWYSN